MRHPDKIRIDRSAPGFQIDLMRQCAEQFKYDPELGTFTRLIGKGTGVYLWRKGPHDTRRRLRVFFRSGDHSCDIDVVASRFAFYVVHGYIPEQVDHINRDPMDDRACNLRAANQFQNCQNTSGWATKKGVDGSTDYKGVFRYVRRTKVVYKAHIQSFKKKYSSPIFYTAEEARDWYDQKAIELNGKFAYTNDLMEAV